MSAAHLNQKPLELMRRIIYASLGVLQIHGRSFIETAQLSWLGPQNT
jgi:hypothetical protein